MLPHQYITFYLYYRADRLAELGVEPPPPPTSSSRSPSSSPTRRTSATASACAAAAGGQDQWLAYMLAGGCRLVDDAGAVVADSQACIDANQAYIDLFRVHEIAPPSAPSDGFAQVIGAFEAGITSFVAHHVGSSLRLTNVHGDALGVMDIPVVDPSQPATMAAMSGNVIFADGDKQDAAWTFLAFLTEHEQMDAMSRSVNGSCRSWPRSRPSTTTRATSSSRCRCAQADYATAWPPLPASATSPRSCGSRACSRRCWATSPASG
jgi:multiple sugar transport system substrate-binding protein